MADAVSRAVGSVQLTCLCVPATASLRRGCFVPDEEPLDRVALDALRAVDPAALGRFGHVLASSLPRAMQTAGVLGFAARPEPALREASAGRWAGLRLDEVPPAAAAAWLVDPGMAPPGGESRAALSARVAAWLEEVPVLGGAVLGGAVLAITHASVVRAVLAAAIGLSPADASRFEIEPLGCAILFWRREWRVRGFGIRCGGRP